MSHQLLSLRWSANPCMSHSFLSRSFAHEIVRGFVYLLSVVESTREMLRGFVYLSSVVESTREMVWWFVYVSSVVESA